MPVCNQMYHTQSEHRNYAILIIHLPTVEPEGEAMLKNLKTYSYIFCLCL